MSLRTSSFPSCFHTTSAAESDHLPAGPPPISGNPHLTTSLYRTDSGQFSLTWSRSVLGRSLHFLLLDDPLSLSSSPTLSFHIHIKPFFFWRKHGSKHLKTFPKVQIFWDLTNAKFGSQPDPQSGFYIAVVVDGEMTLLVGDLVKEAYRRTKARKLGKPQVLVLRREHVFGTQLYSTKASFGGRIREISVDCSVDSDAKLTFSVDNKSVLQIKRLKWKFRGNERVEVDGVAVHISWDVYNWLFEDNDNHKHAVFIFGFEKLGLANEEDCDKNVNFGHFCDKNEVGVWGQQGCGSLGMNGVELKKLRKRMTRRSSSLSLSSVSSASSSCSSSVMEWASSEENELSSPARFSLLVYAWRR